MRKLGKMMLAMTLCVAMLGNALMVSAEDADQTLKNQGAEVEASGDNKLEEPVYKVVVPTTLDFAVDAFQQKKGEQIVSADIYCVNKSNIPVKLGVAVSVAANPLTGDPGSELRDIRFVSDPDEVSDEDGVKSLYIEAQVATSIEEKYLAGANYIDGLNPGAGLGDMVVFNEVYYINEDTLDAVTGDAENTGVKKDSEMVDVDYVEGTYGDSKVAFTLGTDATTMEFALNAADYIDYYLADKTLSKAFKTTKADFSCSASFRFGGVVNPNAIWTEGDFSAKAIYSFRGMLGDDYAEFSRDSSGNLKAENAHQLIAPPVPDTAPTFKVDETATRTITWSGATGGEIVKTIDKAEITVGTTTYDISKTNAVGWDAAAVTNDTETGVGSIVFDSDLSGLVGVGPHLVTITYTNMNNKQITLTTKYSVSLAAGN